MREFTFGSLFAGIGGIDLGLERAGWTCRWQVEWDEYCQHVLAKHWPDVPRYGDITGVDWAGVERVDLLAGGFPCQPVSSAGRKLAQADERWLWPEFLRAVRALRPAVVLVENVTNLLGANAGTAFGDILGDLAESGYDAEWDCIPAATVGAPHERDRVFLLAYAECSERWPVGDSRLADGSDDVHAQRQEGAVRTRSGRSSVAHANGDRRKAGRLHLRRWRPEPAATFLAGPDERLGNPNGSPEDTYPPPRRSRGTVGKSSGRETKPGVGGSADGLPAGLDHRWPAPPGPQYEWEPSRTVGGRDRSRTLRLKALGNAVVPQVVEVIGAQLLRAIEAVA